MFGWLAKMLIKTPVQGSGCACCESKKRRLEKMQQALESGELETVENSGVIFNSGGYSAQCDTSGNCQAQEYHAKILGDLSNGDSVQERAAHCHEWAEEDSCDCGKSERCCKHES